MTEGCICPPWPCAAIATSMKGRCAARADVGIGPYGEGSNIARRSPRRVFCTFPR